MMKKSTTLTLIALVACLFLVGDIDAQTRREVIPFASKQFHFVVNEPPGLPTKKRASGYQVPFKQREGRFLAFSIVWFSSDWKEGGNEIDLQFKIKNGGHTILKIHPDGHAEQMTGRFVSELYFLEEDAEVFNIQLLGNANIDSLALHFFDPGLSQPATAPIHPSSLTPHPSEKAVCSCPQPPFQGRLDWCPDGSCPTDPTPDFVPDPTHVIVHHTAGTNVASDWAAVVRSIWDFHVNTNGWDDVGYNWLVDPNGILYEGRGDGRLGAHFCAQNGLTTGICVMGDFTSIQPQAAALNTLAEFLAWETCDENIDPLGTSFHGGSGLTLENISGHRDGCNTSCPGDSFYPLLPGVRQNTQAIIDNGCEAVAFEGPTVLAITFVGPNKISLSWQDNAVGESGYYIERSDNTDDNFGPIIQLPPNATAFSDNGVTPGNTYFYRVRAKQGNAFSDYSNVAVAVTSPSATESVLLNGRTVLISPNPTSGLVTLSIDNQWIGSTEVSVFDVMGRRVVAPFYEGKNSEKAAISLDLSGLPSGVFWVKMMQGADVGWFKVVKH